MENKAELRRRVLQLRSSLTYEEVEEKSDIIRQAVMNEVFSNHYGTIMAYMDFKNEVMTGCLILECIKRGVAVAVPAVSKQAGGGSEMHARVISDMAAQLKRSRFGILEPIEEATCAINPEKIDAVVVPGVAFDMSGNRIGFGAGYYDRFLNKVRNNCKKIGVAYELQLVENIGAEPHDVPMDMIITENRIIRFEKVRT